MTSSAASWLGWIAGSSIVVAGCGAVDGADGDAPEPPPVVSTCPQGRVPGPLGGCMPVGIQSCAALFLGDDGLCHPTIAACEPGSIPKLDQGCIHVGIPGCAGDFLDADGLCHPATSRCPDGAFAVPGEGCVPVDGPDGCGDSTWGAIPDGPETVHVDPSYGSADSDGSRARPMTTVAAAMERAAAGATIALAAGDYREPVVVTKPVSLVGRCPSLVQLTCDPRAGCTSAAVVVSGARGATVRGVGLGGGGIGVFAGSGAVVWLDRLHIAGATGSGVFATGAGTEVTVTHTWVDGTLVGGAQDGVGLRVVEGATATVDASAFSRSRGKGVLVRNLGSRALVRGALIDDTRLDAARFVGVGAVADDGGALTLERSAVVASSIYGVLAQSPGSTAVIREGLVEGTSPDPGSDELGMGVVTALGASVAIEGSAVVRNTSAGVAVFSEDSALEMTGTLVRDTALGNIDVSHRGGFGVMVSRGGAVRLDGAALVSNRAAGLFVQLRPGEPVLATRTLIEGTLPDDAGADGTGVVTVAGRVALESSAVVGNRSSGVFANQKGSEVTATEVLFENNLPEESTGRYGRGVELSPGSRLTLERSAVLHHYDFGVVLIDDAARTGGASILGTLIQGNSGLNDGGDWGGGVAAHEIQATISGAVIRDSQTSALLLDFSTVSVDHVAIDAIAEGHAYKGGQIRVAMGDGMTATKSVVDLADVQVTGCARVGLLYNDSAGTIARVRVSQNRFGLVEQGSVRPTTGEGCQFTGNAERDVRFDGDFLVPDTPAPLP